MKKRFLSWVALLVLVVWPATALAQRPLVQGSPPVLLPSGWMVSHWLGAVPAGFISAGGTLSPTWALGGPGGTVGPLWNNNGGVLAAKDPTNTTLVVVQGAPPVGANDFTQKGYADTHVGGSSLPAPPGSGTTVLTDTTGTLTWSTVASGFTAATDLSGTPTSQTVVGWQGRAVSSSAPTTGNGYYWSGTAWVPSALNLAGGAPFVTGALPAANQAAQTLVGDANGLTSATSVTAIRNTAVPSLASGYLHYNGSTFVWDTPSSGASFTASVDLAGSNTAQTVVGWQARPVSSSAPSSGNVYSWSGTAWVPGTLTLSNAGTFTGTLPAANQAAQTLAGDATGLTSAVTVGKILNNAVPSLAPGWLQWNGSAFVWTTPPGASVTWANDLAGSTSTSQNVVGIQSRPVASSAPTVGNGYYWSGSAWVPSAGNLAGGSAFFTGLLPAANQAAQTLAGDVGGTTAASVLATVNSNVGTFGSATTIPIVTFNGKGLATAITTAAVSAAPANIIPGTNGQVLTTVAGASTWAAIPTLAGDVGGPIGTNVLATVNSNVGTFGSASTVAIPTVNAKGLTTAMTTATIAAPLASATGMLGVSQGGTGLTSAGSNGQVLTTVTGVPAWATASVPGSVLVWSPSGTASNNVFTSWSSLVSAASAIVGPIQVFFDCTHVAGTCTIPSSAAFTNPRVDFVGSPQFGVGNAAIATVTFSSGVTLSGVDSFNDLSVKTTNSAPIITWPTSGLRTLDLKNVFITASAAAPFITVTGSGSTFNLNATEGGVGGVLIGDSTNPVLTVSSGGTAQINLGSTSVLSTNGASGSGVTIALGSSAASDQTSLTAVNVSGGTTFIFQPGNNFGQANVFGTWASAYQVAIGTTGPVTILFDCSLVSGTCTVPSGTWSFPNSRVTFRGAMTLNGGPLSVVSFASGAVLSGAIEFQSAKYVNAGASPVLTVTGASATNRYEFSDSAYLDATGGAPFISVTGTVNTQFDFNSGSIGAFSSGAAVITSAGSSSVVKVGVGGNAGSAAAGSITGAGATVYLNSTTALNLSSAPTVLNTVAASLGYNDTLASPTLGSSQVQGAIDALKGRVINTLPNPGANGTVLTIVSGAPAWATPAGGGGGTISALINDVTASGSGTVSAQVNSASGTSPFLVKPSFIQWLSGTTTPTINQASAASGTGATMTVQAQQGATGSNGGTLDLLGGQAGSGGAAGGIIAGTGDGANALVVTPGTIDLNGVHNYRIGNWAGNFGTGTGYVMLLNETSLATAIPSGGLQLGSEGGFLDIAGQGIVYDAFVNNPGYTQNPAPAATNANPMTFAAQNGGSGNTNGGSMVFRAGQASGSGIPGRLQLNAGDSITGVEVFGTGAGNGQLRFTSSTLAPLITQLQPSSGSGQSLTLRAQGGGSGTWNGGDTIVQAGIQGTSGLGANGHVILQSADTANNLVVGDDGFTTGTFAVAVPPVIINTSSNATTSLGYVPTMSYSASNRVSQLLTESKHVDVCHIVAPLSNSATCGVNVPMGVHGMSHVHIVTQCRVTTGASGTSADQNVTSDGWGDWSNTTGGGGAPGLISTTIYNQQSTGSSGVFAPITYTFSGNTTGTVGYMVLPFTVRTNSGLNLGTIDCTTWTTEQFN